MGIISKIYDLEPGVLRDPLRQGTTVFIVEGGGWKHPIDIVDSFVLSKKDPVLVEAVSVVRDYLKKDNFILLLTGCVNAIVFVGDNKEVEDV